MRMSRLKGIEQIITPGIPLHRHLYMYIHVYVFSNEISTHFNMFYIILTSV